MGVLRDLSQSECRARLGEHEVGRIALLTPDGPQVIPVNYALVDEAVVFRTSPLTLVATYGREAKIAFEVDHIDRATKAGWSVLVRGTTEPVFDIGAIEHIRRIWEPASWADGARNLFIKLTIDDVSGRRIGDLEPVPALLQY